MVLFPLLLSALRLAAAHETPDIFIAESPAWFKSEVLDLTTASRTAVDPASSPTGISFLLLDRQIDVASHSSTSHIAYRVTAQAGLGQAAEISALFDPSYETLTYHFIRVWRDGRSQDRLIRKDFKLLQQERESDRQLYNGKISALLLLRDVRVGDIVEYASTTRGANPVFAGRFIETESLGWASPLKQQRLRLLVPTPSRPFAFTMQSPTDFKETQQLISGNTLEFEWNARDLKPIRYDADAPAWFVQFPYLEMSDFANWADVVTWALPLYDLEKSATPAIEEKAREITQGLKSDLARAAAVLDFVQQEVRYLGIELGPNSHQPHLPAEVLDQRFGDCKDKVYLLCALLKAIGISAHPILVNSYQVHTIDQRQPTPYAFNHVIAGIVIGKRTYIVDPTRGYQRGNLESREPDQFTKGLPILPNTTDLIEIPAHAAAQPRIVLTQNYTISDYTKPVALDARYQFHGSAAENMRYYLTNSTPDVIQRDYLDSLRRSHPDANFSNPPIWKDDATKNGIELTYTAEVRNLWKPQSNPEVIVAEFYPWAINSCVVQPESLTRNSPLALVHPTDTTVHTFVKFPDDWLLTNEKNATESPWYKFTAWTNYQDRTFEMYYRWQSLSDHVPADKISEHVANLEKIRASVGYTLTRNLKVTRQMNEFQLSWIIVTVTVIVLGAWLWFGIWINQRPALQPPPLEKSSLEGINGWLIFVAIGVTLTPLRLLVSFSPNAANFYDYRTWLAYSSSDYTTYQPAMVGLLAFELIGNLCMIGLSSTNVFLFYRRKRTFPKMMIAHLTLTFLIYAFDEVFVQLLKVPTEAAADAESFKTIVQAAGSALIWIPYFCISRRVKATFTC
ncbi:DUF3857 domain-containing protein [Oleiharenicola lentus]|uniref:DUF3857 domain-containing protein n=1 Tax=Oleiharenicola lentus TaxID=2508720 RepID=UPI003F66682B